MNDSTIVGDVKREIEKQADAQGKHIRLIHQGKMLADDSALMSLYKVKANDFIHCAISSSAPKQIKPSESMSADPDNDDEEDDETTRRGFDRLRSCMSRDEVQAIRLYFYPQVSTLLSQSPAVEGEVTEDRIYRIEEEWMNQQGPLSEFALNVRPRLDTEYRIEMPAGQVEYSAMETEGTYFDMVWGFLMGLLLGFILLFWLWERSVPTRQKLGIILGVVLNLIISMMPKHIPDQ